MRTVRDRVEDLEAAIASVPDMRAYRDTAANVELPAAVIGPPLLTWEGVCTGPPSSARFLVYVIVPLDEWAMDRLWELVPMVGKAIESQTDAVAVTALPGVYNAGGVDLPAYELTVEVSVE